MKFGIWKGKGPRITASQIWEEDSMLVSSQLALQVRAFVLITVLFLTPEMVSGPKHISLTPPHPILCYCLKHFLSSYYFRLIEHKAWSNC